MNTPPPPTKTLYSIDVLRLAASIPHLGRLEQPDGSAELRSPICGSRIIADVKLGCEGKLLQLGWTVSACALGQASAALVGQHAIGQTLAQIEDAASHLRLFLDGKTEECEPLPGFSIFEAARAHHARHPAIILPFDVLQAAMRAAHGQ